MKTRKIIAIVGGKSSGKSNLLRLLANANQKSIRYYNSCGMVAHLDRMPYESQYDCGKRQKLAKADTVWYVDEVYSRKRTPGEAFLELLDAAGQSDLVFATQDEDIAIEAVGLNGSENTFIIRL